MVLFDLSVGSVVLSNRFQHAFLNDSPHRTELFGFQAVSSDFSRVAAQIKSSDVTPLLGKVWKLRCESQNFLVHSWSSTVVSTLTMSRTAAAAAAAAASLGADFGEGGHMFKCYPQSSRNTNSSEWGPTERLLLG